ncbi:DNA mismatch repair protein MutS [Caldicoprobacter faecalis]|uniref:DNA mismatch repair protein MutS n=1 Tax=Caldicoprobacter faecalis TaxID=937334 RepID=A0A1I5RRU1_9FIRM|nr:DNA mismatch repair protein MutS [Caldicoprobacter faecalis]SFP61203.1 DNA mismatch repair protein MutS [Caldicoprobacter faecalis]
MAGLTPMMQQYMKIKEQYKDALLFFRLGDFYELFFDDAVIASRELEIALTGRDCGLKERAPMCGVPYHSVEGYIARLIEKGYKIAICEQMQDPEEAKGLVERQVVRVITPGTVLEDSMLEEKSNNYLVSIFKDGSNFGFSIVDVSTGEFYVSQITGENAEAKLMDELSRVSPREILINQSAELDQHLLGTLKERCSPFITLYHEWAYSYNSAYQKLIQHFSVHSLEGFGCQHMDYGICAAGALMEYLTETQKNALRHITRIKPYYLESYMVLDAATRRNLELTETIRGKDKRGSLLWLLDKTSTAMGGRLIRKWIQQPLIKKEEIEYRLDGVEELCSDRILLDDLCAMLKRVYDLERLMARISYGTANARDLLSLKQSVKNLPDIKKLLEHCKSAILKDAYVNLDTLDDIYNLIEESIAEDPPPTIKEGNIIKDGYDAQLDQYRRAMREGKEWIASLEQKEREKTGIKNLRVGFNKVFGYYIEVTKSYYDMVPEYYIRKQTLANAERYITPELKEMEDAILGAEEKSVQLEYQLFLKIREEIARHVDRIQATAQIISTLDVLCSLARVAIENDYVRPEITTDGIISIKEGRHPVVEKTLPSGMFVPNNTYLDKSDHRLMIITGPNMAGKSTYMRQVALIVLMAQIGSFVPAREAKIGIVDRIFTRIGASDDLSAGQSTFMVEMNEVANILHNATPDSLLILDEIGRGTSTFDGLSIAWAVIEYICTQKSLGCKTLFATHYHELTELEGKLPGVKNYCVSVKEQGDNIIFLRKIVRGGSDKSFGIQVAKLAGLPEPVVERAKAILSQLEESDIANKSSAATSSVTEKKPTGEQLSFFIPKPSEIEEELKSIDVLNITPMEAMNILYRLVEKAKKQ